MTHKPGDLVRPVSEKDTVWIVAVADDKRCYAVRQDTEPDEDFPRKAWGANDKFIPLGKGGEAGITVRSYGKLR
jgi:hypothetical protein